MTAVRTCLTDTSTGRKMAYDTKAMLNSSALSAATDSVYISVRTPNTVGRSIMSAQTQKASKRSVSLNKSGKVKRKLNLF